ncbi:MAG: autotransporter-associated beta strand repeat-containing protein [Akkermansia sp.]|nr:autotransporter-associated beta strand repeat-containing protein [Akkermansia sp.]
MKLHLPKSLRTALLTCLAALAPVAVTLATGAISSGLVAFSISSAYAVDETGDLTSDTNWNAATDHSADTTTVTGATLKVGNGSGGNASLAAGSVIKLGTITLQEDATINVYGGDVADRDSSTDGKIVLEGDITLNNSVLYFSDGSYYVKNTLAVEGASTVRSQWGKAVVLNSLKGDEDAVLTLANENNGGNPAGFYIGTGSSTEALFEGTIKFVDDSNTRTVQVVLNDGTALANAALELDSYSNVIIALERVLAEAVYGTGTIGNDSTGGYGTNADGATLTIVGQAANNQVFSGSVNSAVTWQIGDGSTAASSRFSRATLNGTLNIQGNSAAYLAETNTINNLTGNGTVNVTSGTTAVTTAEAGNGSLYNVSSGAALNFTNFTIASGSTVHFAGNGNVSLGTLTNNGVLDFSSMNGAIGTYTITDGFSLDVSTLGNVANAESLNWNSLLGNSTASGYNAVYADGVVSAVAITDPALHWSATSEGQSWNGSYSWQVESVWANPTATDTSYVLGADATYKSIVVDSDVDASAATLSVNGAYSLSVAQGASYSFNLNDSADSITFADGASLTKVGAGTLKMTSTDALNAGIIVDAGILELSTRDNVSGKTITVNENGTLVFGGNTSSSVQVDVDGTGRVEVVFVASGNHSRNVQLGSDFNGTLAISGLFALTECQVGSDATYEFASGEFWTGGGSVSNNINVVGDSADAFRMRSGGTLTLSGVVTGNYSVGHSENAGTIILANANSSGTIDLDYGTLQLGNDASSIFGDSTSYHSGITVNVAAGTTLAVRYGNANKTKASEAYQLGSVINIKGDARVNMPDGSTYFVNAINVDSGKTFTFVNQWDKHQFLSGITGENVNVVIESPNQGSGNAGLRMVVLTGESEESFSGTLTIKNLEDNADYQRGVVVQSGEVLENVVVSFADEQQGALLLFTDSSYDAAQTMDAAPKANGSVAGLSGTNGKVYAAGVTINTAADTSYTYGGELNITSLTKSGAGAQSLTQGLNLTGALNVQAGTLTLAGIVDVASITNTGIIDITAVETLTIGDLTATDGGSYAIGTLTGYESKDWNALLGVSQDYQVDYSGGNLLFSVDDGTSAIWVGGTGAVWDGTDSAGNATQSWVKEGADFVPSSLSSLILGNADTLTAAGYADAEVSREIIVDSDVAVKSLTVQDSYSLSVAENEAYSFEATSITMEEGATLTKTGEGTLVIGKDVTAITGIEDGTLKLDGTFGGYDGGDSSAQTAHDLTRFTGSGTLAVSLYGSVETNGRSLVSLSDSFTGTLEVCAGALDRNSLLGGTTAIKLNNGGLFGRETATNGSHDFSKNIIVEGNSWLSGQGATGEDDGGYYVNLTGAISGDGELSVKGLCDWHFKGDMSGFTGSIKLESGTGEAPDWVIFHSNADLSALTMNAGTLKVTDNALLAVETLSQTGGAINVASGASLELKGTATLKSISNSGVLKLQNADALTLVGFNDAATTVDGTQTFTLGTVENATEINWNTLTGVSIADYRVKYSGGTVSYASATDTYIVWADTDDEETAWGEGSNWRWADDNSLAAVPTSAQKVQLTADAAHKTITLSGATYVAELNVQGAYELNVADGDTATLSATNLSVGDSGSLTKAGTGTLTMSKDNATAGGISISEGTLKLSEASYANSSVHDLSSITASAGGTLQMNGSVNSWASGTNYGISVILSDDFEGTLKMTSGQLNVNNGSGAESVFGGAKAISLEGATVAIGGGELSVPDLIFNGNNTTILSHGTSTIASDISGSGTINRHGGTDATLNLTGDISYDGTFIQQKATLNLAGDNAAYIKNLKIQGGTVTISSGLSSDSGLTVTGGTTNLNGSSDLGIVSMSNGTFGVNATTQIDELSVTGGTFKINGAEVNVGSLKSGALTLTGAADLTAVLADTAQVTLNGAATADATLSVVAGGSATLSVAESLKSLTVTEGGVLALSGALTLGDLYNTGTLDIANLSALSLGGLNLVDGAEYEVGTLTGADAVDWNTLLGLDSSLTAAYNGSKIVLSLSGTPVLWVGDADSTWDEADENGASTAWKQGENAFNPGEKSAVVLGNAASLGDLNDVVVRTIILDADTVVGSVTVQDAYSLSVADGESHSFDAGTIVLDGGSLSKTGAGTLSMSVEDAVAAKLNIAEGTLSISETLSNYESGARVDLTALSGVGTLSITTAGASGVTGNGTGQRTSVDLADSFTGTLAVVGGNLDMASTIGGTGSVLLDGATLVGTGGVVQELGWNIAVSDKGAYLRRFGYDNSDGRGDYATRLTGALTGSADAMLKVIDAGEWFLAGDMSGYQGGMSIEGNTNYVTFESDATLASLTAVNGSHILVDNNATLTAPALAVSGTIYTGATKGATFDMGAVSIAADATLKLEGAGTHTLSTLAMGNNATLELAANTSASITTAKAGTPTGMNGDPGARDGVRELSGTDFTIKVGTGAELTDAGAWELSGGADMVVSGGGVYHVAGVGLSVRAYNSTSLTIDTDTTLHITGTDTTGSKFGDSFSLGHWDPDNTVTVRGTLELECGLSTSKNAANEGNSYKGYTAINVESGGKLAFNNGLHASVSRRGAYTNGDNVPDYVKENFHHVAVDIAGGGVLEISGTNNAGAEDVYVTLQNEAIVMGGGANGNTKAVFGGTVRLGSGFYAGAVEGTSLTLNVSPDGGWVHVLGSHSTVNVAGKPVVYTAGGTVEFGQESIRLNALNVDAGGTARINHSAELYINQWGSINIAGTLIFDSADTITLNKTINNTGTVEVLNATDTRFVLSDALLQEVVGVSKTWTLVDNNNSGSITGWNALGLDNFLLDGSTLQLGDWDAVSIADGKVMLYMLSRYWDATDAESVWNTGVDANWRESVDSTETVTFESNSRVTFTDTDETGVELLDKSVTVAEAGVQAKSVVIEGTDYVFRGGKVAVTHSLSIQESAEFDSTLVIGSTSTPLSVDVWEGKTLTVGTLETSSSVSYGSTIYNNGAFSKTGEGTLLITDAIYGTITGATVSGGKLVLGVAGTDEIAEQSVDLMVGANTISSAGGSLENVVLQTSGTVTDYTGATAQALNVIKSADDGGNYAVLTDVELRAGAASSYATLQKVAFAGTSALSGYITFEETKQQRQMAVATGGTLTVSNLTFDLHGLSAGTKVLIENDAVGDAADGFKGKLLGWDAENVKLLYSGIAVNNAVVDMDTAGVVTLNTDDSITAANMYWDGLVGGAASSAWDKSSANWSATVGTDGDSAFLALSNTYFGATPEGGSKVVNAALDMVMSNMFVTDGGYSFTGSRLATLGNMSITPASGEVSFANELVVQGNVNLSAAQGGSVTLGGALQAGGTITATGEGDLSFNSTVQSGGDITLTGNGVVTLSGNVSTAGNFSIGTEGAAVTDKADASTLYTIAGALTAKDILINIDASEHTAAADTVDHLVVSGNVSAMGDSATPAADGTITLLGSAAKKFTGYVTADTLRVNAAHDTLNNVITFTNVVDVNTLEIAEDTYVRIAHAGSDMDTVLLGGTLYMDSVNTTYANGYDVYSTSDSAELVFGTISSNTINLISGLTPAEAEDDVADAGQYNSISVNANTRFLTVNALADLKDLTLYNGPMTVKAGEGAIHGNLVVRDAAGLVLTENANNIMAEGSGSITVDHANMNLNSTTQTLRSGNDIYLAGGAITGNANGVGLNFEGTSSINYTGNSTVSANMTIAQDSELTVTIAQDSELTVQAGRLMEDALTLSGSISGTGSITMQGDGCVLLSGANTAYSGTVTVQQQTSLKLGHVDALKAAQLNLEADGTLLVDRAAVGAPFNIGTLNTIADAPVTFADGTTLTAGSIQINSLQATDAVSAADAAFNVGNLLVQDDRTLNLTLAFAEGESLQTMKTYNLFTSSNSLSEVYENLNLQLYIAANNISNYVDSGQYKLVYDATANVIAIRTMLGNIWDGGADGDGDGIWSVTNTDKNWSGKDYDEDSAYNDAVFADLTGEGIGESAVVTIEGTVNPGEIYFEADSTNYELNATQESGAMLAAGNVIHKAGEADVTLNLVGNGTVENALGGMDLQAGATKLAADLAVAGEVSVAAGASLQTDANQLLVVAGDAPAYTAQGTYSGLTMDATGIAGVADSLGVVTDGIINGAAELNNLNLTGTGTLTDVAIGSGVNVATDAGYTLNGHITFLDTLQNSGTVTLDADATVEIGSLGYTFGVAASDAEGAQYGVSAGGSYYMYRLVQGGAINGMTDLTVDDVYINGVKLGGSNSGLANGMAAVYTNNDGVLTLSIGAVTSGENEELKVDGTVGMPSWDERWGKSEAEPALSRRYAGTDAAANISFAEGITDDADYYWYSSVVNADNANKVNGTGNEVVVTLSSASTGARAVGGSSAGSADLEMWMYDRSGFTTVVAGQFAEAATDAYTQNADTHVLVNSVYDGVDEDTTVDEKTWVVGGSWNVAQNANSYVTMQDGQVLTLVGGSVNSNQTGTSYVYIDGGRVFEVVGASYADDGKSVAHKAAEGETLASHLVITGGNLGGLASDGGTKSVYGGGIRANITGDIKVTVDGTATITNLVGGNYQGSVVGDITLDLVSGSAGTVHAAGAGNASVTGDVSVYLSRDFDVSAGLFGGKQNNSGVTVSGTSTLYLTDAGEYVFAQWEGADAGTHDGLNRILVEGSAVTIAGFDVVDLAQDTVLTVDTSHFDRDITGGTLLITGNGIVQVGGDGGARRDIRLEDGATFKLLSSYTANNHGANANKYAAYSKLYVTDGTTFDISGYPRENSANDGGGSIAYHVYLCGDGVDGMGALYKGATEQNNSTNPSGKAALGYIELTGNASATAEHNINMIGSANATTYLDLNGYTYTKRGEGAYVLRNTQINGGTYYAHEGTVQPEQNSTGADADLVLSDAATLKLNDNCNFTMRSLTGAGDTELGAFKLTLAPVSGGKYYAEFMKEANSYDNLMSGTGFAYGVYSGVITGSGSLYIGNKASMGDRTGVQYLSGTDSTYSGGTHVEAGRLYLLSSTQGSISKGGSEVTSGPIGTGALYWDSTTAEVYLGHGVTVYNAGGTNAAGSDLILGVEGAPDGDLLKNYPGVNGTVVKDGVTYHEVDTHNLQSISCDGVYADGTAYVANTEIDRNKMLLVTEENWNSESSTVKGFTDTGYNEATYSGVLSGAAALVKVGAGTLVIDQANAYTGGTRIEAGTLKLKGWAQIGAAADGTIDVEQTAGSTLMLAYDGTYGDELTSISNNMVLKGTGDARWEGSDETGGDTAALISDVGSGVTFTLSGDISGGGNLLHSGEGTLVLSGDSSYTGGMHATRGVVEVQSSMGLGSGAVKIDNTAELHVTVEEGTTASRVATTLAADDTTVQGNVVISGTETTERILNVATTGYNNSRTTLHDNGTLLVNGSAVNGSALSAQTAKLTGSGTVAVSDATGSGASATVGQMTDYTGDLHVEGNNASIVVENGTYSGGSISVSGNGANVSTTGDVTIVSGESLSLTSKGNAGTTDTSAAVRTTGAVNVTNGATLSVAAAETSYEYNLQNLQASASLNGVSDLVSGAENQAYTAMGTSAEEVYKGFFNTSLAMNQKAAGSVDAEGGGLTLSGGASYETSMANTSLMGGTLTLDTTATSLLNFDTTLDAGAAAIDGSGRTTQLVLFSDVGGVNFVLDGEVAVAGSGIYYTRADRYIGGSGYVDEETWLVYDSGAGVVYLDGLIPEPTTATLSLLALAALAARRRRK